MCNVHAKQTVAAIWEKLTKIFFLLEAYFLYLGPEAYGKSHNTQIYFNVSSYIKFQNNKPNVSPQVVVHKLCSYSQLWLQNQQRCANITNPSFQFP